MAIDLISKSGSSEEGTSAINTLNGLLTGLMKYDSDHYEAMDVALADAMRKLERNNSAPAVIRMDRQV